MKKSLYHFPVSRLRRSALTVALIFLGILASFNIYFFGKIFPNTHIAGVNVSGMKPEEAVKSLSQNIKYPEKIILASGENSFELNLSEINFAYDFNLSVQRVYESTRTGNIFYDFGKRIRLLFSPENNGLVLTVNEEELDKFISVVNGQVSVDPIFPSAKMLEKSVVIDKGQPGNKIDTKLLRASIGESLSFAKSDPIQIPVTPVDPSLNDEEANAYKKRAEKYLGKSILITFEFDIFRLRDEDIINFLDPKEGFKEDAIKDEIFKIAQKINRDPQNPKFTFADGKVNEFLPAKDGIELDAEGLREKLVEYINNLSGSTENSLSFEAPVIKTPPETSTEEVNDLGIRELIGRGTSRFRGSISSRVHNIELASSRLNGILINPGDTFSFNDALGDVSKFTGYQEAYIITEGKTVLGDGGGVCQVSTTFFRAALNAGLPILERQAHAYRVGYYEQDSPPGLDATVYGPSPDLKIKNDTPAHILIQATAYPKTSTLIFELYGTSDGRVATTSKPVTANVIPAGDDLYIDDPTLPSGVVKQTEHKANGAKVTFNYLVQRNGETIYKKTFISNYRPWQAVYLRGTGPVQ